MLMNENSELRSLLRLSKNFSKNIINKSIKNNIVLINNDGGCQGERFDPGVHTQYLRRDTLLHIFFYIHLLYHNHLYSLLHSYIHSFNYPYLHHHIHSFPYLRYFSYNKKNASFIETGTYLLIYIL